MSTIIEQDGKRYEKVPYDKDRKVSGLMFMSADGRLKEPSMSAHKMCRANDYYQEVSGQKSYYTLTVELDATRRELAETQEDLAEQIKETAALQAALDAMKPPNDEALHSHLRQLQGRLEQAEALLMSITLGVRGYHAQ